MRDRFPLVMIAGLVLLGVLGSTLFRGAARGSFADTLSTYRSEPDGAHGLYLLAEESGLSVGRVQQSLEVLAAGQNLALLGVEFGEGSPGAGALARRFGLADAGVALDDDEEEAVDEAGRELHRGLNRLKSSRVSKDEREKLLEHVRGGATVVYAAWGSGADPFLDALGVKRTPADAALELRTLVPSQPTPFTVGVERVEARVQAWLELPLDAVPLLVDDRFDEVAAALVPYGQGQAVVLGAPELAMNRAFGKADNAQFWLAALGAASATGPLAFDEFHHGFTSDRSIAEFAKKYGLHFAAAQLLLGLALWAAALRRFGRPLPPPEDVRLGSTDALYATSRLYREGKHFAFAAGLIANGAAVDLAPAAGLPSKASPKEIAAGLRARGRDGAANALLEAAREAPGAKSDADVLRVARASAQARAAVTVRWPTARPNPNSQPERNAAEAGARPRLRPGRTEPPHSPQRKAS